MSREKNITSNQNFLTKKKLSVKNFFSSFFQSKVEKGKGKSSSLSGSQLQKIDSTKPLIIILSSLPFLIGFFEFLNQKYSAPKKGVFFDKNLPGLGYPTQKINWDTFQYLNQKDKFLSENFTENIYLFDRNILISAKKTKQNQKLITSFKNFSLENPQLNYSNSFYQNFDELPFKLQDNNQDLILDNNNDLTLGNYDEIFSVSNLVESRFIDKNQKRNFHIPERNLTKQLIGLYSTHLNQKQVLNISINSEHQELFELEKLFTKKINTIFLNPSFDIQLNQIISNLHELSNIKKLLFHSDLEKVQPRFMSGYVYPDMSLSDIISYNYHKIFSKITHIIIDLPQSYLTPLHAEIKNFDIPNYLIQTQQITLYGLDEKNAKKIIYQGPAIKINSKSGFDWYTESVDSSKTLRNWLENTIGPANILPSHLMRFFGSFESPGLKLKTEEKREYKSYWYQNLLRFRTGTLSNQTYHSPTNRLISKEFFYSIPTIQNSEWKFLQKEDFNEKVNLQKKTEYYQQKLKLANKLFKPEKAKKLSFLPIVELTKPKAGSEFDEYTTNNFRDFEYLPYRLISQDNNFVRSPYQFWDLSTNVNLLSSGTYHKLPSIFSKNTNSNLFFSRNWEPLTVNAWLTLTKLSFGLVFFNILKILAVNYGKELLEYLIDLVALLGVLDPSLKEEIEYLIGKREKGFRIIKNTKQNFSNIAGSQNIFIQIIEIVWFLRNSGREFKLSKNIPRGILLTGPPGTGKTILVQAIAGEAQVPVFALSGSSLLEPGESGAVKLQILFEEARKSAPCIVFIDEVDTLAQKREHMTETVTGTEEILETLSQPVPNTTLASASLFPKTSFSDSTDINSAQAYAELQKEKLRLLLQFLVELDGIKARSGVIVIAATNRPEILDPAVLRPGRFDKIIDLGLPGPEKRKEIFKLYSTNLGVNQTISWDYLTHRTAGYSAADIAGIMNQSTLYAILNQSCHTIETIEYGIDRITTLEKSIDMSKENGFALQLAYYQAGKILLSRLLKHHPPAVVAHLWPRRPNARALQINENLQKHVFRFAQKIELEHRLIGCYAGKAAEILFLETAAQDSVLNLSDYGLEDLQFAQNLSQLMIKDWLFYSENVPIYENTEIPMNFNSHEYRKHFSEKISFLNNFINPLESNDPSLIKQDEEIGNINMEAYYTSTGKNKGLDGIEQEPQEYDQLPSWQLRLSNNFEFATRTFSNWYRLYLPDQLEKERNLEWIPPDEYYHSSNFQSKLTENIVWNDLSSIKIDYQLQSLILESFNTALILLNQHRQILDKLAYELLIAEVLHQGQIDKIIKNSHSHHLDEQTIPEKLSNDIVISQNWGLSSRKPKNKSISINFLKTLT